MDAKQAFLMIFIVVVIFYLLIKTKISHGSITTENYFHELWKLNITLMLLTVVLVLIYYVEDIMFDGKYFGTKIVKESIEVSRLSESKDSYTVYFLTNEDGEDKFNKLTFPKDIVNVNFKNSYSDKILLDYKIKLSKKDKVLKDFNFANFKLPKNYIIEKDLNLTEVNDLKIKHFKIDSCLNQIKYKDNIFTMYIIKDYVMEYTFKEQKNIKMNIKKGETGKYNACVHLDYYSTLNNEIIKKIDHEPVYELVINDGFEFN